MWNFSDDKGVIDADPFLLRSNIFPRRTSDIRIKEINTWLDQLVKARFIVPLEFENKSYYITRTFNTHQRIDEPKPSKIPIKVISHALNGLHSENVPGTIPAVLDSNVQESKSSGVSPPPAISIEKKEGKKIDKKNAGPPKITDVVKFFASKLKMFNWMESAISLEAQHFYNHYKAEGWKVNGRLIEDWTAKANEWIIRELKKR